MSGEAELEAFASRWLAEHPEASTAVTDAAVDLACFGSAGVLVEGEGAAITVTRVDPEVLDPDRPYTFSCAATLDIDCAMRPDCRGCPGYAAWRAKVRSPYEVRP